MNRKHPACQCGDNARDLGLSRHEVPTDDIAQVMSRRQCHERLSASRGAFGGIRYGTKPADQYWSRGLCCRPRPTCASQALKDVTLPPAESTHGRPCPKWNSNPHALAGMRLRSARVYQFRHSGTSTKTTKLLAPTSQATSRCLGEMIAPRTRDSGTKGTQGTSFDRDAVREQILHQNRLPPLRRVGEMLRDALGGTAALGCPASSSIATSRRARARRVIQSVPGFLALGSPVGGGAWSVAAGAPRSSVRIGLSASAQI